MENVFHSLRERLRVEEELDGVDFRPVFAQLLLDGRRQVVAEGLHQRALLVQVRSLTPSFQHLEHFGHRLFGGRQLVCILHLLLHRLRLGLFALFLRHMALALGALPHLQFGAIRQRSVQEGHLGGDGVVADAALLAQHLPVEVVAASRCHLALLHEFVDETIGIVPRRLNHLFNRLGGLCRNRLHVLAVEHGLARVLDGPEQTIVPFPRSLQVQLGVVQLLEQSPLIGAKFASLPIGQS
mmetsp:Transcript_351/g.820  ORF Transcript_351/g.820 Transcript_351/m.820 type:complete len:240 (+) Transcript_351:376-1095(+)